MEQIIRKILKTLTAKDTENIILSFLTNKCECCNKSFYYEELIKAHRYKFLHISTEMVDLCSICITKLCYYPCFKCKFYSQNCYQVVENYCVCNWCCANGVDCWCYE